MDCKIRKVGRRGVLRGRAPGIIGVVSPLAFRKVTMDFNEAGQQDSETDINRRENLPSIEETLPLTDTDVE